MDWKGLLKTLAITALGAVAPMLLTTLFAFLGLDLTVGHSAAAGSAAATAGALLLKSPLGAK